MDYNYVRMRNAEHADDRALAEHYRKLYEAGPRQKTYSVILNYIMALLTVIAVALGIYIACSNGGSIDNTPQTAYVSVLREV